VLAASQHSDEAKYNLALEAASWCSIMLANSKKSNLKKLLTKQRKRKRKEGVGDNRKALLEGLLGKDWGKTEAIMAGKVASSDPAWLLTFDVAGKKDDRIYIAGNDKSAGQIQFGGELPEGGYAVKARAEVADIEGRKSFRVLFELPRQETLGVIFKPNRCVISEWRNGGWVDIADAETNTPAGKPFDVTIAVDKELIVLINDKEVVKADVQHQQLRERLYIGTNQSVVWLENARVEAL